MARLIPRETKFFDMFAEISGNLIEGARVLHELFENWDYQRLPEVAQRMRAIEHRGDEMTHKLLIKLNQTFITPFDREDIHLLASSLDDVLDFIYGASNRLVTYKITQPSPVGQGAGRHHPEPGGGVGESRKACWRKTTHCWATA